MPSSCTLFSKVCALHPSSRTLHPFRILFFSLLFSFIFLPPVSAGDLPWTEHAVRQEECVDAIAERYGISPKTVERANELVSREDGLKAGEKLLIPKRDSDLLATLAEVRARQRGESLIPLMKKEKTLTLAQVAPKAAPRPISRPAESSFLRPLAGRITSPYGMRRGRLHDGVDIPASAGTPIVAARAGTVIFSGSINGFGRTVTIDHGDGMLTRYSHNSANLVKKGDTVRQGQPVAKVGRSGRASCNHLHFTVLLKGRPVNPEKYLR